jgi:hypothetical protein
MADFERMAEYLETLDLVDKIVVLDVQFIDFSDFINGLHLPGFRSVPHPNPVLAYWSNGVRMIVCGSHCFVQYFSRRAHDRDQSLSQSHTVLLTTNT